VTVECVKPNCPTVVWQNGYTCPCRLEYVKRDVRQQLLEQCIDVSRQDVSLYVL
jgi:hypothetical protein